MQKTKFNKNIFVIILLTLALVCSAVGITFSYFHDKKSDALTFTVARLNDTNIVSDKINSSDLVCEKTFTKNVTLTNKANFNYYIRVWAECSTQVYEKQSDNTYVKTTKTDLVNVTGVTVGETALTLTNNKYVYSTVVETTTSSLTFKFAFKVSKNFTEEVNYRVVDGNWVLDDSLTTTITFKAEIIQSEAGLESWS